LHPNLSRTHGAENASHGSPVSRCTGSQADFAISPVAGFRDGSAKRPNLVQKQNSLGEGGDDQRERGF
jgi:hypothetical protein